MRRSGFLSVGMVLVGLQVAVAQQPTPPVASPAPQATLPAKGAADPASQRQAAQAKCWADLQALCPNIESRQDRVRCIRQHRAKLPPSCTEGRRARGGRMREACSEDIEKLCADVPRGRELVKCLIEKRPEVSEACGKALDARRGGPGPVRRDKPEPTAGAE